MLLKPKAILNLRWTLKKKLNLELRVKTVSYSKIVFYNLKCLLIRDIADYRDKISVVC